MHFPQISLSATLLFPLPGLRAGKGRQTGQPVVCQAVLVGCISPRFLCLPPSPFLVITGPASGKRVADRDNQVVLVAFPSDFSVCHPPFSISGLRASRVADRAARGVPVPGRAGGISLRFLCLPPSLVRCRACERDKWTSEQRATERYTRRLPCLRAGRTHPALFQTISLPSDAHCRRDKMTQTAAQPPPDVFRECRDAPRHRRPKRDVHRVSPCSSIWHRNDLPSAVQCAIDATLSMWQACRTTTQPVVAAS